MSTSYDSEAKLAKSKQKTSTAASFPDRVLANGIQPPATSKPPSNLAQLKIQISRQREESPSPSESELKIMVSKLRAVPNEQTILLRTSQLLKEYGEEDNGYVKVYNQAFTAFPKNLGFNNGLLAAQPDMVEGLEMPAFAPFPIREKLGGAAVPNPGWGAITLPHIAGEWKGPGGLIEVARNQAAYDGACMVYGRNKALLFADSPDLVGYAQVFTFITDGEMLQTFAHYSSHEQGKVVYYQYPIADPTLLLSYNSLKESRQLLRNLQDMAKEASEKLRDDLLRKWSAIVSARVDTSYTMESDQKQMAAVVSTRVDASDTIENNQKRRAAINTIEEPSEVDHESNVRKSRRKLRR